MSDPALVKEVIAQMLSAIGRIERRSARIVRASDFVSSDAGIDMLDSIGMMLIAIGESCKNLDKSTGGDAEQLGGLLWRGFPTRPRPRPKGLQPSSPSSRLAMRLPEKLLLRDTSPHAHASASGACDAAA